MFHTLAIFAGTLCLTKQMKVTKKLHLKNGNKTSPGTATKNLTASRCPWKQSCACAIEQYGMNVPGVTLSLFSSPYTRITLPGRFPEPAAALLAVKEEQMFSTWKYKLQKWLFVKKPYGTI